MKVPIVQYPNDVLTTPAREVTREELEALQVDGRQLDDIIADLTESMHASKGVGLAAPQIGLGIRVLVYQTRTGVKHLINPVITKFSQARLPEVEGCLSLPGFRAYVMRNRSITAVGHTLLDEVVFKAEHDEARVLQHEIDHLDGVLMTSRVGVLDTERAKAFLHKLANPVVDSLAAAPVLA